MVTAVFTMQLDDHEVICVWFSNRMCVQQLLITSAICTRLSEATCRATVQLVLFAADKLSCLPAVVSPVAAFVDVIG